MYISENIPIDADTILREICKRQQAPWNNSRINSHHSFPALQHLFEIINSGIPKEDFFYQGELFRLHTPYGSTVEYIDTQKEKVVGKIYCDGSCWVLPYTEYTPELVAFSKSCDFTRKVFYKVNPSQKAILLHVNTHDKYGIDVTKLLNKFGVINYYGEEQEVLFPLMKEFLVKEYNGTPNKFKYYLRKNI